MAIRMKNQRLRPFASLLLFGAALQVGCAAQQTPEETPDTHRLVDADVAQAASLASPVSDSISDTPTDVPADEPVAPNAETATVEEPEAPAQDESDRDRLESAVAAGAEGDLDQAERIFRSLQNHELYGPYARYNLGVLAFGRGDREGARRYFDQALELQPGFGPAVTAIVRERLIAQKPEEAEQFVRAQLAASDNASGVRAAALFIKLHARDYEGVIRDTRGVMIDEPTNIDAHYALAMANLALGRVELADYILNQAMRRDALRADIRYGLARVALARGREVEARRQLEKALELNPHYPEANVDLASLQLKKLEYAAVVEALEPVTQHIPEYVPAWINLGSGLKGIGKHDEAKAAFLRALELEPNNAAAAFNLGILYLDVTRFEDLEQLPRMEMALEWFSKYRAVAGTISEDDPVHAYEVFVRDEIQMQEDLARQAAEDAERARLRAEREAAQQEAGEGSTGDEGGSDDGFDDDWDDW